MDHLSPILDAFDRLDLVLAVFGALVVAMWFGRGKSLGGILTGALMGGLVKPTLILVLGGGLLVASQQSTYQPHQTREEQDKTLEFWSK
jgi:hypothetical protein